jgi:hypothetical protein
MAGGAEVVIRATCSRRLAARFGYVVAMKDQRIGCGRGWSELARRDAAGEKCRSHLSRRQLGRS